MLNFRDTWRTELLKNTLLLTLRRFGSLDSQFPHNFQNGDVQNLKFSVMDKSHTPLVAACKVVEAGNRNVLQPENQGCSFIEDVCSKRRKRIFDRKWSLFSPVLGRQSKFTKAVSIFGRVAPKRAASLPVSPVTSAETNMVVSVEESGPVSVEEFGSANFDEDVVQEAEELKHFLLQFCLPKPKLNYTMFLICHSEVGALRVSVAEDFHLVIAKMTRKRRRQNRFRLSLWITGSSGNRKTEHTIRSHCSSCGIARVKVSGVIKCRRRVWYTRTLRGL